MQQPTIINHQTEQLNYAITLHYKQPDRPNKLMQ